MLDIEGALREGRLPPGSDPMMSGAPPRVGPTIRTASFCRSTVAATMRDVTGWYRLRPEHKSLSPNGTHAGNETIGKLRRRPILSAPVLTDLIGKESNRLLERLTGEVMDSDEYGTRYGERASRWEFLVKPVLREMGSTLVSRRTGRSRSAVERAIRSENPATPHSSSKSLYVRVAANWIESNTAEEQSNPLGVLYKRMRNRRREDHSDMASRYDL
jgi:hypothetical protein